MEISETADRRAARGPVGWLSHFFAKGLREEALADFPSRPRRNRNASRAPGRKSNSGGRPAAARPTVDSEEHILTAWDGLGRPGAAAQSKGATAYALGRGRQKGDPGEIQPTTPRPGAHFLHRTRRPRALDRAQRACGARCLFVLPAPRAQGAADKGAGK